MLEGAARVLALYAQVAVGVAGHLACAQGLHLAVHVLFVELGRLAQINLVALHRPAAHKFGGVGLQICGGREGLYLAQQFGVHAHGAGHQGIVEEVAQAAGGRLPAHMAHLARLCVAAGVAVGLGGVVVIAGLGMPAGADVGVKRPVGQVDAVQRVRQRGVLELVGRKPAAAVPLADAVADLDVADLEGQNALRRDGVAALFMRHDGGRAAKIAALGHAAIHKDRNCLAVLALHLLALAAPATPAGGVLQGCVQVLLHDLLTQFLPRLLAPRHQSAAVGALERLRLGIPLQVGTTLRARVLAHHGGLRGAAGRSVRRGRGISH